MEVDPSVSTTPASPTNSNRRHASNASPHVHGHAPVARSTSFPSRTIDIARANDNSTSRPSTATARHGFLRSLTAPISYLFPLSPTSTPATTVAAVVPPTNQLHRDDDAYVPDVDDHERATLLRNINADDDYAGSETGTQLHSIHVGMSATLPSAIPTADVPPPPASAAATEPPVADDSEEQLRSEMRQLYRRVHHIVPFVVLLALYFTYLHTKGIFIFVLGTTAIIALDQRFRAQVAMKDKASIPSLAMIVAVCAVDTIAISAFNGDLSPVHTLLKPVEDPSNLADVVWTVMVNDLVLRLGSLSVKAVVAFVQLNWCCRSVNPASQYRRKRKLYAAIEQLTLLVRSCLAGVPWYAFYGTAESTHVANLFQILYFCFKVQVGYTRAAQVFSTVHAAVTLSLEYGSYVSASGLAEVGSPECSICYDAMQTPVQLPCAHMFCEECIAEWFDRERSCPLCRADVNADGAAPTAAPNKPMYLDGSTSIFPQVL